MSILQERVIKQLDNLSDDNLEFLLEIISRFMMKRKEAINDINLIGKLADKVLL